MRTRTKGILTILALMVVSFVLGTGNGWDMRDRELAPVIAGTARDMRELDLYRSADAYQAMQYTDLPLWCEIILTGITDYKWNGGAK